MSNAKLLVSTLHPPYDLRIYAILVKEGQVLKKGDPICASQGGIDDPIVTPVDCTVDRVCVHPGQTIGPDDAIIVIKRETKDVTSGTEEG